MATNHSVTAPVDVAFECVYCGHARAATVAAEGYGTGTSAIFFDRNAARAAKEADASLLNDAQQAAKLLECPKCRRRSRAAVTAFVARTALLATPFVLTALRSSICGRNGKCISARPGSWLAL